MAYEGDAAEQVIRIALSGGDVALRLTGSLVKNVAAFLLAMRRKNKVVYGRKSLKSLMKNTRDLRIFDITPEQFKAFTKLAGPRKILYAGVGDRGKNSKTIDLMIPVMELERANAIFSSIGYTPANERKVAQTGQEQEQESIKKKDTQSRSSTRSTKDKSTSQSNSSSNNSRRNSDKPSVTAKLEAFDKLAKQQGAKPKVRAKARGK